MNNTDKSVEISTRDNNKEWRYSSEKNGITKSCCVKQVENGYTVRISKYGRPNDKEDSEYIDESKEFISKVNPLESQNVEESISDAEALANILEMKQVFGTFNS